MNCNTTHYRANSSSVPGDPTASAAPKILALVSTESEDWLARDLLSAVGGCLGPIPPEQLLAMARDAKSPLRLFAVHQLGSMPLPWREPSTPEHAQRVREAAATALDDPNPMTRTRAIAALSYAASTPYVYIVDAATLARLAEMAKDESSYVKMGLLDALQHTVLRRGLIIPEQPPAQLPPQTMRLLRWPTDWQLFPLHLALLDDHDPKVREKAAWMLGIATGYWYGYKDIRLEGQPELTSESRSAYREMWEQMSSRTPAEFTAWKLDSVVRAMAKDEQPELHGNWLTAIRLLTGRSFGWKQASPRDERAEAIARLQTWWEANRGKHPAEWIVDAIRENGFKTVDDYNLYVLGRWAKTALPVEAVDAEARRKDPDTAARRILEWWDASKADLQSASLSR